MDTWTAASGQASAEYLEQARINRIESGLRTIKQCMPEVYALIKSRAEEVGSAVYALVRRGLGGEPGCFYAFEAGHVVGQPRSPVSDDGRGLKRHQRAQALDCLLVRPSVMTGVD